MTTINESNMGARPLGETFDDKFQRERWINSVGVVGDADPAFNRERSMLMQQVTHKKIESLFGNEQTYRYRRDGD